MRDLRDRFIDLDVLHIADDLLLHILGRQFFPYYWIVNIRTADLMLIHSFRALVGSNLVVIVKRADLVLNTALVLEMDSERVSQTAREVIRQLTRVSKDMVWIEVTDKDLLGGTIAAVR
jgi:hypothetical protein